MKRAAGKQAERAIVQHFIKQVEDEQAKVVAVAQLKLQNAQSTGNPSAIARAEPA